MAHVTLSIPKLKALSLTPDEFVYLWCLSINKVTIIQDLLTPSEISQIEDNLINKEYAVDTNGVITITAKSNNIINLDGEKAWEEFKSTYPSRSPIHKRNLRSGLAKAREKYKNIIRNDSLLHEQILEALKRDIKSRQLQVNGLEYMPAISTYVNQKLWEDYLDESESNVSTRPMNVL